MSYPFDAKLVKYNKQNMTVREFHSNLLTITDCNPIGQRPAIFISKNNKKSVQIIESMLTGVDITSITLVDVKDEPTKWQWESLDGGHRKRAIRDYMAGEFRAFGMTYSELPDDLREQFLNYELAFTLYEPLSNEMKGHIFRKLNNTTPVNDQETLNSYGDIPVANAIRETVRVVTRTDGRTSLPNDLFETTKSGNFKYISDDNQRLKQEEWVARVYYSFYTGGKLGNRTSEKIKKMYVDKKLTVKAVKQLKKKVDNFLDFMYEMGKSRSARMSSGLGNSEKNALLNLYLYLSDSYGSDLECTSYLEWYDSFSVVFKDLFHDVEGKYKDVPSLTFESKESTLSQLFSDYTRNHDSADKQKQMVIWMTEHPKWQDTLEHTMLKDRNRSFPRWMKEIVLQNQGYVCYIDGMPLTWDDAEAGHIVAHAKGGKTVLENCAMIRKSYNSDMGTMDVNEYKEFMKEPQKVSA